jgi:drug/metabolite transporter (DMT)-like permease
MGIGGVALLIDPTAPGADKVDPVGAAALLAASAIWSVGTLYASKAKMSEPPLLGIGMQMTAGGVLLLLTGLALGEAARFDLGLISQRSWIAFVYLVFVGALIGFTAYLWLVRKVPPALATTYAFVNPVIAIILGALILSEPASWRTLAAGAVIIAAVAIITQAKARPKGQAAAPERPTVQKEAPEPP